MSIGQPISPRFIAGLHANIAYWQQKFKRILDTNAHIFRKEFPNLVSAIQFGIVHPATRIEAAKLMCQSFYWVEQTGQWDDWLPLMSRLLPDLEDEKMRCRLYKQQGQLYRSKRQTDAAIDALQKAANCAQAIKSDLMLAEAYLHLSAAYLQKRDLAAAEQYALLTLQLLKDMKEVEKLRSAILFIQGRIAFMQADYAQAEAHLTEALLIGQGIQPPTQLARILSALATTLHRQRQYGASEQAYLDAIQLIDGTDSWLDKVRLQLSLGSLYVEMRQLDNAEFLFLDAEQTLQTTRGQFYWIAMTANNLGNVLLEKGDLTAAEYELRRSVELRRSLNTPLPLANSYKSWGKSLYRLGRFYEATTAVQEALLILSQFEDDTWAKALTQECAALLQASESVH